MAETEAKVLELVASTEGSLLDEVELVQTLQDSNEHNIIMQQQLKESTNTEEELNGIRQRCVGLAMLDDVLPSDSSNCTKLTTVLYANV